MILEKLKNFINNKNLHESTISVACSGGLDSMALLSALLQVHDNNLISCIHLDHGWHESSKEAKILVEDFCKKYSIKFFFKSYEQDSMKKNEKTARDIRYDFFDEIGLKHNVDAVFLAHNLNDNVETIIFRLFRGSSSAGLKGIPSSRRLRNTTIYRPLLESSRDEIKNFAESNNIIFFEDPSNIDIKYHRNLIRHKIIPEALKINSQALSNVIKLAKIIEEEQNFINKEVEQSVNKLGDLPWNLDDLQSLDPSIRRKILEQKFCPNIEFVDLFLEAIKQGGFHRINFKKNKFFTIKQKKIHLEGSDSD